MKTTVLQTAKELKAFLPENRKNITEINGIECNEMYPIIEASNKHASYYKESTHLLRPPFVIKIK